MTREMVRDGDELGKAVESSDLEERLRAAMHRVVEELMESEVTELLGAGPWERSDERRGYRNGHRNREWDTRLGRMSLQIPKLREGGYLPSFLERNRSTDPIPVAPGARDTSGSAAGAGQARRAAAQARGVKSAICDAGAVGRRVRMSVSQANGSTPAALQLSMIVYITAARRPPSAFPQASQSARPTATFRMDASIAWLSISTRPSRAKTVSCSHCPSA